MGVGFRELPIAKPFLNNSESTSVLSIKVYPLSKSVGEFRWIPVQVAATDGMWGKLILKVRLKKKKIYNKEAIEDDSIWRDKTFKGSGTFDNHVRG